jgi:hypothetical protein
MPDDKDHKDFIEKLFQQKADEFDIPYREEDWLKLEKKLDIRDLQLAHRKKIAWLTAATLLIISMLGYFTLDNYQRINELSRQIEEPTVTIPEIVQAPGLSASDRPGDDGTEESNRHINIDEVLTWLGTIDDVDRMPESGEVFLEGADYHYQQIEIDRRTFDAALFNMRHPRALQPHQPDGITELHEIQRPEKVSGYQFSVEENNGWLAIHDDSANTLRLSESRFAAGFIFSPDLSTAGSISNFDDPGYKIGVTAEYKLSPRVSLISGIIFSDVRYTAKSSQYNPSGYWGQGYVPDQTAAVCHILDIPISLKFNFINNEQSRFFATAGFSSYIMLNEDYNFFYDDENDELIQNMSIRNGSRHILNNTGFSIGYEFDLHRNVSLRAEPYIKIPISEVGWGNVKLYSIGSFISLNVNL